jgi:retron-type reverse transcriptase
MVDSTLIDEIKMTLKMQKVTLNKANRKEQARLAYAKKVQDNPEFYKQEKIRIREYNRNRYAVDPEFAERLKSKRREVYQLKKEANLSA